LGKNTKIIFDQLGRGIRRGGLHPLKRTGNRRKLPEKGKRERCATRTFP
jgi:hypothetical protein